MTTLALEHGDLLDFAHAARYEWLLTNGRGGFACGTVAQACTRRYHGWLVASLRPPVQRTLLVAKCDVAVVYRGTRYALGSNEYADGTLHPRGYLMLTRFALEGQLPVWTWAVSDLRVTQRLWMAQGSNTTYMRFAIEAASAPVEVVVEPLCSHRDYHGSLRGGNAWPVRPLADGCVIEAWSQATPYQLGEKPGTLAVPRDLISIEGTVQAFRGP